MTLFKSLRHKGFVGPKYTGLSGKLRLLGQGILGHEEVVSYAEKNWWVKPRLPNPDVTIQVVDRFDDAKPWLSPMRAGYLRDFSDQWRSNLSHGQTLILASIVGRLAAFIWFQDGSRGAKCHYIRLHRGEVRLFRAGVLPEFRSKKVHSTHYILALERLFAAGAERIFVDAFADNEYARRGQQRAGFREFGRIDVRNDWRGRKCIRWL